MSKMHHSTCSLWWIDSHKNFPKTPAQKLSHVKTATAQAREFRYQHQYRDDQTMCHKPCHLYLSKIYQIYNSTLSKFQLKINPYLISDVDSDVDGSSLEMTWLIPIISRETREHTSAVQKCRIVANIC